MSAALRLIALHRAGHRQQAPSLPGWGQALTRQARRSLQRLGVTGVIGAGAAVPRPGAEVPAAVAAAIMRNW